MCLSILVIHLRSCQPWIIAVIEYVVRDMNTALLVALTVFLLFLHLQN